MSVIAIRSFLHRATRVFDSRKAFRRVTSEWHESLRALSKGARSLADHLNTLVLSRVVKRGREVANLGKIEGREFVAMMRTARSADAFERATGTTMSRVARQAFRRVDDIAELHFPDVALLRQRRYVTKSRDGLMARKALRRGEAVRDARRLESLVRSDAEMLGRVNRLSTVVSRTKKILILGGTLAATGVGVAYLCDKAARYAAANTGCFVYVNDNGKVGRCRALGCSCPLDPAHGTVVGGTTAVCRDEELWQRMRLNESECGRVTDGGDRYCVHCDWDETDPDSVNYVDRTQLPDGAYVRCERQDALDALNEMIGGTIDSAWDAVSDMGKQARNAFASSLGLLPWVMAAVALFAAIAFISAIWKFGGFGDSVVATTSDGRNVGHDDDDRRAAVVAAREHDVSSLLENTSSQRRR